MSETGIVNIPIEMMSSNGNPMMPITSADAVICKLDEGDVSTTLKEVLKEFNTFKSNFKIIETISFSACKINAPHPDGTATDPGEGQKRGSLGLNKTRVDVNHISMVIPKTKGTITKLCFALGYASTLNEEFKMAIYNNNGERLAITESITLTQDDFDKSKFYELELDNEVTVEDDKMYYIAINGSFIDSKSQWCLYYSSSTDSALTAIEDNAVLGETIDISKYTKYGFIPYMYAK